MTTAALDSKLSSISAFTSLKEATAPSGFDRARWLSKPDWAVRVCIIKRGLGNSRDRNYYSAEAIIGAAQLFEGRKAFADHPDRMQEQTLPERSIRDVIGWYDGVKASPNGDALYGTLHVLKSAKWLWDIILDLFDRDKLDLIGISINAEGETRPAIVSGSNVDYVTRFTKVKSADVVTEPAAGGEFLQLLESRRGAKEGATKKMREAKVSSDDLLGVVNALTTAVQSDDVGTVARAAHVAAKQLMEMADSLKAAENKEEAMPKEPMPNDSPPVEEEVLPPEEEMPPVEELPPGGEIPVEGEMPPAEEAPVGEFPPGDELPPEEELPVPPPEEGEIAEEAIDPGAEFVTDEEQEWEGAYDLEEILEEAKRIVASRRKVRETKLRAADAVPPVTEKAKPEEGLIPPKPAPQSPPAMEERLTRITYPGGRMKEVRMKQAIKASASPDVSALRQRLSTAEAEVKHLRAKLEWSRSAGVATRLLRESGLPSKVQSHIKTDLVGRPEMEMKKLIESWKGMLEDIVELKPETAETFGHVGEANGSASGRSDFASYLEDVGIPLREEEVNA